MAPYQYYWSNSFLWLSLEYAYNNFHYDIYLNAYRSFPDAIFIDAIHGHRAHKSSKFVSFVTT